MKNYQLSAAQASELLTIVEKIDRMAKLSPNLAQVADWGNKDRIGLEAIINKLKR